MSDLSDEDIKSVLRILPYRVDRMLREHPLVLAGGFVRDALVGETPKDIDLFPVGGEDPEHVAGALCGELQSEGPGLEYHITTNAVTIPELDGCPYPVQIIKRWRFDDADRILDHFDFAIAQAAIWYDPSESTWMGRIAGHFWRDMAQRRLRYTGSDEPGASLLRAFKFARRGFHMPLDSLARLVADVARQASGREDAPDLADDILANLIRVDPGLNGSEEAA